MSASATSPSPRLYPELCDIVIDNLHDDKTALAMCAMVCRSWVPASRAHQFRTLSLDHCRDHTLHSSRLDKVIWDRRASLLCDASSTVLPFVRHLMIHDDYFWRGTLSSPSAPHWLNETLPGIQLHLLTALRSLSLFELCWHDLSQQSQSIIHRLCGRTQCLSVWNLITRSFDYAVLDIISGAQTLEVLKYEDEELLEHFDFHPPEVPANWQMPQSLHSLHLDGSFSFILRALIHYNSPPHVHTLTVSYIYDAFAATYVAQYIQHSGKSLHAINLHFFAHEDNPAVAGHFCRNGGLLGSTSLQTLQLDAEGNAILAILQQITSTTMEKVVLWITPSTLGVLDLNQLATLFRKGPLSRAALEIIGDDKDVLRLIEARAVLYEHLDFLRAKGQLQFKCAQGLSMDPSTPSLGAYSATQQLQFPDLTLPYK